MISTRRLRLLRAIAVLTFFGFTGKLFWMQVVEGSATAAEAMAQSTFTSHIPALRGQIQDINGLPLAVTIDARNITADQTLIRDPGVTAQVLAPVIGADPTALERTLTGTHRFVYVAKEVTPQVWKEVQNLTNLSRTACARVDSALLGRKSEFWFFWTSASLPATGPSTPPTPSQITSEVMAMVRATPRRFMWESFR